MSPSSAPAPVLHVTNASSKRLHHGRVFNIMAQPRRFERFEGNVPVLTPAWEHVMRVKAGLMSWAEYRERYEMKLRAAVERGYLAPGAMLAVLGVFEADERVRVPEVATLVCACSKAAADRGECHRIFTVSFLRGAGWRVVLDGRELP